MIENCSELQKMPPVGDYQARTWRPFPDPINGRPAWAMRPDRAAAAV
jgi:hypothetical protein